MSIVAERYPAGNMETYHSFFTMISSLSKPLLLCILLGFLTNLDQFIAKLPGEGKFRPMGELLHSYKQNDAEYEMYQVIFSLSEQEHVLCSSSIVIILIGT